LSNVFCDVVISGDAFVGWHNACLDNGLNNYWWGEMVVSEVEEELM